MNTMNHHATQFADLEAARKTVATLSGFVPLVESLLSLMAENPVGKSQHLSNRCGVEMVKRRIDELLAVAQTDPRVCAALGRSC